MNALDFNPSKVTVNMDPVALPPKSATPPVNAGGEAAQEEGGISEDAAAQSGERRILWMVRTANAVVGPVSLALVERGLNLGRIPEDAEVTPENTTNWRPVRDIFQDEPLQSDPGVENAVVVAAPVVPIGEPEFEWPDAFSPHASSSAAPPPSAQMAEIPGAVGYPAKETAVMPAPVLTPSHAPQAGMPQPQAVMPRAGMPQAVMPQAVMPQAVMPQQAFVGEEPISIPTTDRSPALIAFGVTIAACAFVAAGIAVLQAL